MLLGMEIAVDVLLAVKIPEHQKEPLGTRMNWNDTRLYWNKEK